MSAIGPQFYEFIKKLDENNGKLPLSVTSRAFQPEFEFNNSTCYLCNGYYGPSFGEPVCVTCHEFLYPDIPHHLPNSYVLSEKTDDGDSGNDEPSVGELLYNDRRLTRALQQQGVPNWAFRNSLDSEASPEDPVEAANVRGNWMYGSYNSRNSVGGSRANEGPREGPSGSHLAGPVSGSHEAGPSVDRSSIEKQREGASSNEGPREGATAVAPSLRQLASGGPREGPNSHHQGDHREAACSIPKEASCLRESPSKLPREGFSGKRDEAGGSARDSGAGPSAGPKEGPSYGPSEGASFRPRAGSNSGASGPREGANGSNSGPVLNRVPGYSYYGNLVHGLDPVKDRPNKHPSDADDNSSNRNPADVFNYGAVRVRRRRNPNDPDDSSDDSPIDDRPIRGPDNYYSANGNLLNRRYVYDDGMGPAVPDDGVIRPLPSSLARSIAALSTPRPADNLAPGLVESLPSEVVLCVFSYLDDLSLSACARVCVRWARLVRARVPPPRWAACALRRWPLFNPLVAIHDWHKKYQALVESCFCRNCVVQMCMQSQPPFEENAWRRNRLRNEIKMLRNTPPEGCAALPLDPKCCHWQAMVTGPVGSPYEGGVFYLYIQVPYSYPMSPPVVRFLTRILHPNVSRHGDVGIDSVHHNWSLALTISKLLISIQSLLTDPYTAVCMEPEVGEMYVNERARFERIARRWTWRYAMHDMYSI